MQKSMYINKLSLYEKNLRLMLSVIVSSLIQPTRIISSCCRDEYTDLWHLLHFEQYIFIISQKLNYFKVYSFKVKHFGKTMLEIHNSERTCDQDVLNVINTETTHYQQKLDKVPTFPVGHHHLWYYVTHEQWWN